MISQRQITFVVPTCGSDEVLTSNFLASPCLRGPHQHQILIQKGYPSASKAYNDAIDRAENDLMVFCHQDMIFPEQWLDHLERSLVHLEARDPSWGVLGCYGMRHDGVGRGWIYTPGNGEIGSPFEFPQPIQTLDEVVLILRKSSSLRFDEGLPHYHLYGADICLRADEAGLKSYAISAFCVHNANHYLVLPKEFYESYRFIRRVWKDSLPIYTTCIEISTTGIPMYRRRVQETYLRHIRHKTLLASRVIDGTKLLPQTPSIVSTSELTHEQIVYSPIVDPCRTGTSN